MKEERIRSRTGKKQIFFFHENIQDLKEYSLQTNMKSKEHQFFSAKTKFPRERMLRGEREGVSQISILFAPFYYNRRWFQSTLFTTKCEKMGCFLTEHLFLQKIPYL